MTTFFIRCGFDLFRHYFNSWYSEARNNSIKNKTWRFPLTILLIVVIVDFLPLILFISNLKFIWTEKPIISQNINIDGMDDTIDQNSSGRKLRGKCYNLDEYDDENEPSR